MFCIKSDVITLGSIEMYGLVTVWTSMDDGPYWVILLKYGSHDMRHTGFRRLTVVNGNPGFWVVTLGPHFTISIFSLFSLGFISRFNKFLISANNHLINIHLTIPRKIPKLAQLYPEYIIIFIIKIVGYFWGIT